MKLVFSIILFTAFCSCQQKKNTPSFVNVDTTKNVVTDNPLQDSVERHIQFLSDEYFSNFKTPIEVRFFSNGLLVDSIIKPDFFMMSWYSIRNDTIDLVAHIGQFETSALLLRFVDKKTMVFFLRAPHERQKIFRLNKKDPYTDMVEVPPVQYELKLSQIPDTVNKQVVYGYINMESKDYYDKRDSLQERKKIKMRFYFRSQLLDPNF